MINAHLCFASSMFLLLPTAIEEILRAQTRVAACLEYAAHLERPGHFPGLGSQVIGDLHRISDQPIGKH